MCSVFFCLFFFGCFAFLCFSLLFPPAFFVYNLQTPTESCPEFLETRSELTGEAEYFLPRRANAFEAILSYSRGGQFSVLPPSFSVHPHLLKELKKGFCQNSPMLLGAHPSGAQTMPSRHPLGAIPPHENVMLTRAIHILITSSPLRFLVRPLRSMSHGVGRRGTFLGIGSRKSPRGYRRNVGVPHLIEFMGCDHSFLCSRVLFAS